MVFQTDRYTDWQKSLIEKNLLVLSYNAWEGYQKSDRGVVVVSTNSPNLDVCGEQFSVYFVPRSRLAPFLNAWLAAGETAVLQQHFTNGHILQAADTYNPETDLVLLLESGSGVTFFYLQNLPISPPACHQQIQQQKQEFQLSTYCSPQEGSDG